MGVARALAVRPELLLMDEPFSALDPVIRAQAQADLARVQKRLGTTVILVTHDMRLAADVSDHVLFLHQGRVEEEGPPDQIFRAPRTDRLRQFLSATMAV